MTSLAEYSTTSVSGSLPKYTLAPAAVCRDPGKAGVLVCGPGTGPPVQVNSRYKYSVTFNSKACYKIY